jgi:hypothetical protein
MSEMTPDSEHRANGFPAVVTSVADPNPNPDPDPPDPRVSGPPVKVPSKSIMQKNFF